MEIVQVRELVNTTTSEVLGESILLNEDLSNVVEVGDTVFNSNSLDNYVRSLVDHIGRMVFVNRVYSGRVPSIVRDAWEYGAVLEKVSMKLPDAEENESWELTDGTSYDPNIFHKPQISAKFYNKRVTFEIPISITELQVKSAFSDAVQLNSFLSMIQTAIANAMTVKIDALVMRTLNGFIADTMYNEFPSGTYTGATGAKAVNLLYLYNTQANTGEALTVANALTTPEFIRFASMMMANYIDRIGVMSTIFNIDGAERFTSRDRLHVVLLSEFKNAAGAYLQSDTFHNEYTELPDAETVPFWQGSGLNYAFTDTSAILVTSPQGHAVNAGGILGVMFDRDALGVSNLARRVTTHYNAKAEFWNEFHKTEFGLWNDPAENFIVFYIA